MDYKLINDFRNNPYKERKTGVWKYHYSVGFLKITSDGMDLAIDCSIEAATQIISKLHDIDALSVHEKLDCKLLPWDIQNDMVETEDWQ